MFRFIFKNALTKKARLVLTVFTIIVSCTVGILAVNVSNQVSDGIIKLSGGYDLVIGPQGSESQLAFNSMFFTDQPLGTIDYSYYEKLTSDKRVNQSIPFAQGDSFNGFKIVGTTTQFLENSDIKINGNSFENSFEAVIGYNVAKNANLKIGSSIISSHGLTSNGHKHEKNPYTVVGIMEKTNTNYDNIVFTSINSVWESHESESIEEQIEHGELSDKEIDYYVATGKITQEEVEKIKNSSEEHGHEEDEDHDEEHEEHDHSGLTAILVKSKNPSYQNALLTEYNKINGVQAITPTVVLRNALESVDLSKQIVFALSVIIFVMSIIILFIINLLSAQDMKNDIKLMRLLGVSSSKIYSIFITQTGICSAIGILLSFLLSKVGLYFINNISTGYGLVINPSVTYNFEYLILLVMFVITLIPVVSYITKLFKKDITQI